jgi:hypothetical protein
MPLNAGQRASALIALVRGVPAETTNPISLLVAAVPGPRVDAWGEKFYAVAPVPRYVDETTGEERAWADLNAAEKSRYLLNAVREHFVQINRSVTPIEVAETARQAELVVVDTETSTDLGSRETV